MSNPVREFEKAQRIKDPLVRARVIHQKVLPALDGFRKEVIDARARAAFDAAYGDGSPSRGRQVFQTEVAEELGISKPLAQQLIAHARQLLEDEDDDPPSFRQARLPPRARRPILVAVDGEAGPTASGCDAGVAAGTVPLMVGRARPLPQDAEERLHKVAAQAESSADQADRDYQTLVDAILEIHESGDGSTAVIGAAIGLSKQRVHQIIQDAQERRQKRKASV